MPAGGCLALPELRGIRCGGHLVVAYDRAVDSSLVVRPARVQDVRQMARVHVRCWQETYRGLMPDAVLDDPGFPAARERMWTDVLTSERYRQNRVAVAERDDELAGIAMSGPPDDATAAWARQLYVLYVYAAGHGTGAGEALLEAVIDPAEPAGAVGRRSQPSRAGVLPQARLRCRRDRPVRGRGAGDPHGPRRAARRDRPLPPPVSLPSRHQPRKPDFQDRSSGR